jgi:N-acetylglucosamine-6-sulfatase
VRGRLSRQRLRRALASLGLAVCALAVAATVLTGGAATESSFAQDQPRPNVLVVMTDDQDVKSLEVMDVVKREIAGRGTSFRNAFATFPLCCPSRATFLTGQYAHNHGVMSNHAPEGGYPAYSARGSLPLSLRRSGYRTAWIGKFMNGYGQPKRGTSRREVPRGWDRWVAPVGDTPHLMYDYMLNDDGALRRYGNEPSDYLTDVLAGKAAEFIRASAPSRSPFFLTVAPLAPHKEKNPPGSHNPRAAPRHQGSLRGTEFDRAPSFNERDVSDKPPFVRKRGRLDGDATRALRGAYYDRRESLLAVDEMVGRLLSELRRAGELRDTLIVFTSDNGYMLGEHRLRGKNRLYEESVQVPLVMRGPGVPRDSARRQLVGNIDLAPTILDAAGAKSPLRMDGRSLFPLANHPRAARSRDILLETARSAGIRTRRYLYAEHQSRQRELYDLRRDPFQLRSRHSDRKLAPVRRELARELDALRDCAGRGCS